MFTTLEAAIGGLVVSAISVAVGLGAFSGTTAQVIVAAVPTILAAVFVIANEIKGHSLAAAGRGGEIK
jgi:hypothetical protein